MEKIIIDIGSGSLKAYNVDSERNIKQIYKKTIMFKVHFTKENGINAEDKEQLIHSLNEIKKMNPSKEIHAYATSIFRLMNEKQSEELKNEILEKTGILLSIVTPEKEAKYIEKSVGNIPEISDPYLVFCVGGSSTELIVLEKGEEREHYIVEFAVGDLLKKFPEITENVCSVNYNDIYKYIEGNFTSLPKTKCKYAIFTGSHLTYNEAVGNKMEDNKFFYKKGIPKFITTEDYKNDTIHTVEQRTLNEMKAKYPQDPKYMEGTRACVTLITYILEKMESKYIFPTDLNMIDGIVNELYNN